VPLLIEALRELNPDMRCAAAMALGKIAGGTVWPEERPWNAYTEEYRNEWVFPKAMTIERRVAEVLELQARVRDTVVPPLAEALEDGDRAVRFAAARALGNIGAKAAAAAPALVAALDDEDADVRRSAARAIGNIEDHALALPPLARALADPDSNVRWTAARSLSKQGAAAVPILVEALADENPAVRRIAAQALEDIGDGARLAIPALARAAGDADPDVRLAANRALEWIALETPAE